MDNYRQTLLNRFAAQEKEAYWITDSLRAQTLQELLDQAAANVVKQFKGANCVLLLTEEDHLVIKSAKGLDLNDIEHKRIPIGKSFSGRLAKRGECKLFSDVLKIIHTIEDNLEPYYCGSLISTPLIFNKKVIGLLNVYRPAPSEPFSPDDFNILVTYGRHTAFAIENQQLIDQRTEELRKAQENLAQINEQLERDIEARKKAEQYQAQLHKQLEKINQELEDFAYVVSHDLKAPLRGIGTLTDWILTDYADKFDQEGKENMALLSRRVKRMHNLIEGVLQYSRVGRIQEEKIQVNLNELLPSIIDSIAPPENITITIKNELPVIEFEETRITQVFQNLLSNAVKYMDKPQGKIEIGCAEENGFWKFSVSDNGPGIEDRYFEKIFKIFQTLSSRDEFESTGVGLTLVKKITELYGGKVWLESKVGEGTTFFFTLLKQKMEVQNAELEASVV
jgi:signal transduction histidine kinase